jgi:hypothetical protein
MVGRPARKANSSLKARLNAFRVARRLPQSVIAEKLDCDVSTVCRMLKDGRFSIDMEDRVERWLQGEGTIPGSVMSDEGYMQKLQEMVDNMPGYMASLQAVVDRVLKGGSE